MSAASLAFLLLLPVQSPDGALPQVPSQPPPAASPDAPPPAAPEPAALPAAAPAPVETTAPAAALAPAKKGKFDLKEHLAGLFVAGVGLATLGLALSTGVVTFLIVNVSALPFPGDATERKGFTSTTTVAAAFLGVVGAALVTCGVAMFAVSFL
ncbi:MAG: hypothetical protein HY904_18190 [Deltaproteobacteria bacterium]|nr:hypothetical protein [Deltaproteobacteria bacterium]